MIEKIMNIMNDIEYGYVDIDEKINNSVDKDFSKKYKLQSPEELLNSKIGVCWDQVELERYLFSKDNIEIKTYFIVHYDNEKCPTHTFLIYKNNDKYYWFEHSWAKHRGIHEYRTIEDAIKDIKEKFIKDELNNVYQKENLCIYEYNQPDYGIGVLDFYHHCEKGKNIIV